jgi:SAM-dependent methyltransferase
MSIVIYFTLFFLLLTNTALGADARSGTTIMLDGRVVYYEVPGKVQSYYESSPQAIAAMFALASIHPGDVLYDLGSGDGRIVFAAARQGAKAVGIEIDPLLAATSRRAVKALGLTGFAEIREGDFFKASFTDATLVTLFLGDDVNAMLKPQLQKLKRGTRIVSNSHAMAGWKPVRSGPIRDCEQSPNKIERETCQVFLWVVK